MGKILRGRSKKGTRTNSRRGTANSKYLRVSSRAQRPPGPYRPQRKPRPAKDTTTLGYWAFVIFVVVLFGLGEIWKESQVSRLCTRLDSMRETQRDLNAEYLTLQLKYNELASYSRIEPLARKHLGMLPPPKSPVIIASVDEHFLAYRKKSFEDKRK